MGVGGPSVAAALIAWSSLVGAQIAPDFSVASGIGQAPLPTRFVYTGRGPTPEAYLWSFGDGGTSTERDPVHLYTHAGEHDVALTVTVGGASWRVVRESAVEVAYPQPAFPAGATLYATVDAARPVAVVDVTADGLTDVVAAGGSLVVWTGNGTAFLHASQGVERVVTPVDGRIPAATTAVGDLDDDGLPDLAGLRIDGQVAELTSRRSVGDGVFVQASSAPVAWADPEGSRLALVDLDGDGALDAAAGHGDTVTPFANDGGGGLGPAGPDLPAAAPPGAVLLDLQAGDLEGDGLPDLVAVFTGGGAVDVAVWSGDGRGGFDARCALPTGGESLNSLVLADVDEDGVDELLTAWAGGACDLTVPHQGWVGQGRVRMDDGPATCAAWSPCAGDDAAVFFPYAPRLTGRFDGLWGLDLVGTRAPRGWLDETPVVLMLGPQGAPSGEMEYAWLSDVSPDAVGDLDGDGLDEVVGAQSSLAIGVLANASRPVGWTSADDGLAGASGDAPVLSGAGAELGGGPVSFTVEGGPPHGVGALFGGAGHGGVPLASGALWVPDDVIVPLAFDGAGRAEVEGRWPLVFGSGSSTRWRALTYVSDGAGGLVLDGASAELAHVMPSP